MERLTERVKVLRHKMNWSQEDLARRIGVSLSTVQRWETKGGKPIRLARMKLERLLQRSDINSISMNANQKIRFDKSEQIRRG